MAKVNTDPDVWGPHVFMSVHLKLDDAGIPTEDDHGRKLGLVARVAIALAELNDLRMHPRLMRGDQ